MTCCDLNAILSGLDTPNHPCYLEVCAARAARAARATRAAGRARGRATRSARGARRRAPCDAARRAPHAARRRGQTTLLPQHPPLVP